MRKLLIVPFCLFVVGCGDKALLPDTSAATNTTANQPLPPVSTASGQIILSFPESNGGEVITGYVVGKQSLLPIKHASTGEYYIDNVPSGKYDVIVKASPTSLNLTSDNNAASKGIRLSNVEVLNGIRTTQDNVTLASLSSISGAARLGNGVAALNLTDEDSAGILVYVPGTEYSAYTASDGTYSISNLPSGVHNFYFEKDGYHRGQVEAVEIAPGATETNSNVSLAVDTGAEGGLSLASGGYGVLTGTPITLIISATPNAILMKIGQDTTFVDSIWQPIKSTLTYETPEQTNRFFCVKFADGNGLESSPYCLTIAIRNQDITIRDNASFTFGANQNLSADGISADSLDSGGWRIVKAPTAEEINTPEKALLNGLDILNSNNKTAWGGLTPSGHQTFNNSSQDISDQYIALLVWSSMTHKVTLVTRPIKIGETAYRNE